MINLVEKKQTKNTLITTLTTEPMEPLSEAFSTFQISGQIIKATNLPKENRFYYMNVQAFDQPLSCYILGNESRLGQGLVTQYAKGVLKRRQADQGVSAHFVMSMDFSFREYKTRSDILKHSKITQSDNIQKSRVESNDAEASKDNQAIDSQVDASQTGDNLHNETKENVTPYPESSLLNPFNDFAEKNSRVNNQRVAVLFEVFSVNESMVTDSVGFCRLHVDPVPGSQDHKLPIMSPKKSFLQSIKAQLIGELMSIENKRQFVSEESPGFIDQRLQHNGWVWVTLNVVARSAEVQSQAKQVETTLKMKQMFVKHKQSAKVDRGD